MAQYDWFIYEAPVIALPATANAVASSTLQIAADAPFQVQFITVTAIQAAAVIRNFGGLLQLDFTQMARTIANVTFPIDAISLSGQQPYELRPYRLIPNNSSVVVTATNANAATATNVYVALHGNKIRGLKAGEEVPGML